MILGQYLKLNMIPKNLTVCEILPKANNIIAYRKFQSTLFFFNLLFPYDTYRLNVEHFQAIIKENRKYMSRNFCQSKIFITKAIIVISTVNS